MTGPTYSIPTVKPYPTPYWDKFTNLFSPLDPDASGGLLAGRVALFVVAISGTILLVKLIMAGYAYLISVGDQNKIQNATKEITNAVVGLVIVVSAYYITQILEVIFGVKLL
ncbi:hypothetical protein HZB69_00740 [Candidatus Amesbacteria bacterium]|nr:hypothetical protein [Candidatus Amesbacteria bacterium]